MDKVNMKNIKQQYGNEVIHTIRRLEITSKSIGRHKSHLRFNLQCKHTDIIPKSLKVKTSESGKEARTIVNKAEKALLNIRIKENHKNLKRLKEEKDRQKAILATQINNEQIIQSINTINEKQEVNEFNKSRDIQKSKYERLKNNSITTLRNSSNENQKRNDILNQRNQTNKYSKEKDEGNYSVDKSKENWVKNYSSKSLSKNHISLLSKGAGFAIAPTKVPVDDYIISTELACKNLDPGSAATLRAEINEILRKSKEKPNSNLTKAERTALRDLKSDKSIVILPADKGKCLVVMDKVEYINKMEEKLKDESTYKQIHKDPTLEIQEKLSTKLKEIHDENQLNDKLYRRLFPNKTQIPRMFGQPKVHKENHPLREIVDGSNSVTKDINSHIAKIIKPLAENNEYRLRNSEELVDSIKDMIVQQDEILISYDVVALYPSVPQEEAINLIFNKLKNDDTLSKRTSMTPENIIKLFKLCVENTYFIFNNKLYIQINGLAIGAPTSGFAADIYMEGLEKKALLTFTNPPSFWKRYVDDTISKIKLNFANDFLTHLNSLHPRIRFTDDPMKNKSIPFLDTEIIIQPDNTIKIKIFRKPTHTDQYLSFKSNHHIQQKLGIISTFRNRINKIVTTEKDKRLEEVHMRKAMKRCDYPEWTFRQKKRNTEKDSDEMPVVSIPYTKNLSEKIAKTYKKYKIKTVHKPSATIKNILVKTKDPVHELDKPGALYHIKCKNDGENYCGETERAMKARGYEHKIISHKDMKINHSIIRQREDKTEERGKRSSRLAEKGKKDYKKMNEGEKLIETAGSSEVARHMLENGCSKDDMELEILGYERNWMKRGIKEAINIRKLKPTLNQDKGRHYLPVIWNNLIGGKTEESNHSNLNTSQSQRQHAVIIDNASLN